MLKYVFVRMQWFFQTCISTFLGIKTARYTDAQILQYYKIRNKNKLQVLYLNYVKEV